MGGLKRLRKIQLGRETTAGTEVNASTLWRGTGTIQDLSVVEFPEEDVGYLAGVGRTYIAKVGAQLDLDETPATFEQLLHLFEMGIKTATTATAGGGVQYPYALPTTAQLTNKTYTVEAGDNQQEEQFLYGYAESIKLSGAPDEAVMMSATIKGRQVAPGTYTTSITVPTVETILFNKGTLYIDTAGGSYGGTQKTSTFLGFTWDLKTGWEAVPTGDGALYFTFIKCSDPELTLSVTFEHDATSVAEIAAWRAETARLVRVKFVGATLTTTGTTYTTKTLMLDQAGKWESFEKIGERAGNDIVTGVLRSRYDLTKSDWGTMTIVCDLTAVP